jgi:outer membrane receptor for monomeric catechols
MRLRKSLYTPGPTQYIDGLPIVKDDAYISSFDTKFTDLALFGELTAHLTSKWSLTGGTRLFRQTVEETQVNAAFFQGPIAVTDLTLSDSWRKALWKVNTSYQLDPTNLVYATWSQGFRRGGVNALPSAEYEFSPTRHHQPGAAKHRPGHGRQLRDRRQGNHREPASATRPRSTTSSGTTSRKAWI